MSAHRNPSAPNTAPDFLLSRGHGSVRTQGSKEVFTDPWEAVDALKQGRVAMVVGALPFERDKPAALTVPEHIIREDGPLEPHAYYRFGPGSVLHASVAGIDPSPIEHLRRVNAAISTINNTVLNKVVLARAVDISFEPPVDPLLVAARLIDNSHNKDGFIADLTPAGPDFDGHMLVGSSPEVLIKRQGSTITAYPLAGSAPRLADPVRDEAQGQNLLASAKNLKEHSYVVNHLRTILEPLCSQFDAPTVPELTKTNEMWHLATPIVGTLKYPHITALELAIRTHPTPAICGTPTDAAEALIIEAESPRNFYAGAVGWCDSTGDGEYMVAIRCAEVSEDGTWARAWAGGGIVAESDAQEEFDETTAKLQTIMRSLGL
ncbi:isochorismate synthase [[Brevibacterium] flavum]|uniref:isochorismate synthase n=1 Tax=[Brevibacterium] flavum TaxID=92706 RepID=A0A0F6Z5B4_9CORY|nr:MULTISPECIES: isochorismate synthase MenF [Corynebacterium]AKF27300.1 isochorismate synthase [[Brevibacterium] flavum]ANE08123.1 isochorismate synthase [Corynebacterium glutamicum]AST20546.1 isochorismate synthase [Corynebacterium glutamicum ATCC 14067]KEI23035.1 isochorismate synthase [Corynebacterium glutamicum ATCC 14067]KIH73925.1 isochorismate synthase [Corynebacterium glutamicum]